MPAGLYFRPHISGASDAFGGPNSTLISPICQFQVVNARPGDMGRGDDTRGLPCWKVGH